MERALIRSAEELMEFIEQHSPTVEQLKELIYYTLGGIYIGEPTREEVLQHLRENLHARERPIFWDIDLKL